MLTTDTFPGNGNMIHISRCTFAMAPSFGNVGIGIGTFIPKDSPRFPSVVQR